MSRSRARGVVCQGARRSGRARIARHCHTHLQRLLTSLASCLPSSLLLHDVLQEVARGAAQLLQAPASSLWRVDAVAAKLYLYTSCGDALTPGMLPQSLTFQQDAVGWVARHGQALVVPDVASETRFVGLEHWCQQDLRSFAGFPIFLDETLFAVLALHSTRPFAFTSLQQSLLAFFLARVRATLHNAQLYASESATRQTTESSLYAQATMAVRSASLYATESMTRAAMEEATRAKNALLANMSHELRTPLNAIINYSELLQEDATDQGHFNYVPDLKKIHLAGQHLLARINDILDFARMEAGEVHMQRETFNIPCLVQEVLHILRPMAAKNDNTLEAHVDDDVETLHGDRAKVRQILLHLLSNACKFTSQGHIVLAVSRERADEHPWMRFQVRDTGIGMHPDQIPRLFQPFMQVDDSLTRKYGGTGMGLAISQRLCHMMGGEITVVSTEGQGSTFTIYVPASRQTVRAVY